MRRKKKLFLTLLIIAIVGIILAFCFFFFIQPLLSLNKNKSNDSQGSNSNQGKLINLTAVTEPNIEITLPEEIKEITPEESNSNTASNPSQSEKTYTPIIETSDRYLITKLSNNELTLLIGDDSSKLLNDNSKVQVGLEYKVSGIEETIVSEYYFTIDNYSYPIVLLLGESGKLYYIDIENAYQTGNFVVSGYIENIPEVENVYQTTVEENGNTYRSAVISCTNGEGYEFNIGMIGR